MTRSTPLAPMIGPDAVAAGTAIRSPKTAELVAGTLRRMVVDGQLKDGDFLPNEAELMAHFSVSRPTLREAVRVLESERLVEVRRGSRTGARVRVPGAGDRRPPGGLLLELSGATIADVLVARSGIEPLAVRLLAESATAGALDELEAMLAGDDPRRVGSRVGWQRPPASFTGGWCELSGNATLTIIAGMLHEITVRHTAFAIKERRQVSKADYDKLIRSYRRLLHAAALGRRRRRPRRTGASISTPRANCCSRAWRPSRSATSCGDGAATTSRAPARCRPTAAG